MWSISALSASFATGYDIAWGLATDIPVPGTTTGRQDRYRRLPAVQRHLVHPAVGHCFKLQRSIALGAGSDVPVPGDYDGDGRTDVAVYSSGTWSALLSSSNYLAGFMQSQGVSGDVPVAADYDGDGKIDLALYTPTTGTWSVLLSGTSYASGFSKVWGAGADRVVPMDFDGDGKADLIVYHPSGLWDVLARERQLLNEQLDFLRRLCPPAQTPARQPPHRSCFSQLSRKEAERRRCLCDPG